MGALVKSKGAEVIWTNKFTGTPTERIQRAIDFASSIGGATVAIPYGAQSFGDILGAEHVTIRGQGNRATVLTYTGSGIAFLLGGNASALYYGLAIRDLAIILTSNTAKAVALHGTQGAKVDNLYIEGLINNTRTTQGIVIDGKNASSFSNHLSNIVCNHIHANYLIQSTGTAPNVTYPTQQHITNCSAFGDVATDPTSIGLLVGQYSGNGTIVVGGNLENCGFAHYFQTGAGSTAHYGTRFESNTADQYLEPTPAPQLFFGLINLDKNKIIDNSGTGYSERHQWLHSIDANAGTDFASPHNSFSGSNNFKSANATATPIKLTAFPSQSADLMVNETSAHVRTSGVGGDGNYFGNKFQFPAVFVPSSDPNALDDYREPNWTPVVGGDGGATTGQTYSLQHGSTTKIGNMTIVTADIVLTAKGSITGNLEVQGLPLLASGYNGASVSVTMFNLNTATVGEYAWIDEATQVIKLGMKTGAATSPTRMTTADITNTTKIFITVSYRTPN